jgi:hypothetical protein
MDSEPQKRLIQSSSGCRDPVWLARPDGHVLIACPRAGTMI